MTYISIGERYWPLPAAARRSGGVVVKLAVLFAAALFGAVVLLSGPGAAAEGHGMHAHDTAGMQEGHDHGMPMSMPGPGAPPFEREMSQDMDRMMRDMHAPGYSGNRDIDFLAMMIPHHQGAIDMARLALIYGTDPLTRNVAQEIIASQQSEIEAMTGRLKALRAGIGADGDEYPALSGTRGGGSEGRKMP